MEEGYLRGRRGMKVRTRRPVRLVQRDAQRLPSGRMVLDCRMITIPAGEELVYINRDYGAGSDSAMEVTLQRANGAMRFQVEVGWCDLPRRDFEEVI